MVTDNSGNQVESIAYYPFGGTRSDNSSVYLNYKYTGQEQDSETGLYNYNARLYDPDLARFLAPDTIVPDPANPQSFNRYSYVLNNPMDLVDPTGHHSIWGDILGGLEIIAGGVIAICAPYADEFVPELEMGGLALMGYGVSHFPSDIEASGQTTVASIGGPTPSSSTSSEGGGSTTTSGGTPLGNTGITITGPLNILLTGGTYHDIVSSMYSGGGNYNYGSAKTLSLAYGLYDGSGGNGFTGGISFDAAYGAGSQWGSGKAASNGTGIYIGLNQSKIEAGTYNYNARSNDIFGGRIGFGGNLSYYKTDADTYFNGESSYSSLTVTAFTHSRTYSDTGEAIGWTMGVGGKGLGASWENGKSNGTYSPFW